MSLSFCAICTSERGPFAVEDGYRICARCNEEMPREVYGPERAYEGAGPAVTHFNDDLTASLRARMGDEAYERETERNWDPGIGYVSKIVDGKMVPRSDAERARIEKNRKEMSMLRDFDREGRRLAKTGAKRQNAQYIKWAAANADRVEIKRGKR